MDWTFFDWTLIGITILSLVSSILAWIVKLKWSKEYKEAKEAQITTLKERINHLDANVDLGEQTIIQIDKIQN